MSATQTARLASIGYPLTLANYPDRTRPGRTSVKTKEEHKMKFKNLFLGLSLFILLGASALAKDGAVVSVKLMDSRGTVVAVKMVDADGGFTFDNLPPGTYTVRLVVTPDEFDSGKGAAGSTGKMGTVANNPLYESKSFPFTKIIVNLAKVPDTVEPAQAGATAKQTQGATFGEKVSSGKFKYVMKVENVQKAERPIFIKMEMIQNAVASNSGWIKIGGSDMGRATSGLKDTMKTQVRAVPMADVEILDWSWGTSNPNSVSYQKIEWTHLADGTNIQVQVKEKTKYLVGHVTLMK